jgi:S-phase kinase-associated protein 1
MTSTTKEKLTNEKLTNEKEDTMMLTFKTSDGKIIKASRKSMKLSTTITTLVGDLIVKDKDGNETDPGDIPVPNVNEEVFINVIKYCDYHTKEGFVPDSKDKDSKMEKEQIDKINKWDTEFIKSLDPQDKEDDGTEKKNKYPKLCQLILAANALDIAKLLDQTCLAIANLIKGKDPKTVRNLFNIKNDFAPGEEEKIRKENDWCEETK